MLTTLPDRASKLSPNVPPPIFISLPSWAVTPAPNDPPLMSTVPESSLVESPTEITVRIVSALKKSCESPKACELTSEFRSKLKGEPSRSTPDKVTSRSVMSKVPKAPDGFCSTPSIWNSRTKRLTSLPPGRASKSFPNTPPLMLT